MLVMMDLLGLQLGLPKLGLGWELPGDGLGLTTLTFLLYSIIIVFEA